MRRAKALIILATAAACGYIGARGLSQGPPPASARDSALRHGRVAVLTYIGGSNCGWSNDRRMPGLWRDLESAVRAKAATLGVSLVTLGISQDMVVDEGIRHLRWIGEFEEVATGHGWHNTALWHYVFKDLPGSAGTPQVVLTVRTRDPVTVIGPEAGERVVRRLVGLAPIAEWVGRGVPFELPNSDAMTCINPSSESCKNALPTAARSER